MALATSAQKRRIAILEQEKVELSAAHDEDHQAHSEDHKALSVEQKKREADKVFLATQSDQLAADLEVKSKALKMSKMGQEELKKELEKVQAAAAADLFKLQKA
eukprot:CAMPEP_0173397672 /NCGR_PEP_ID=MMETSP1356-20130122/39162_1 /TAXON_ID=77927 ORGANISM="Hemiselmis virescens, Strain PCC157" /NCGR_SAMPLE_ID=MMETSP1356 /ASSEMBLY_ACC=CAM_ASM_000847 /LENGTH=103 /DNA_ID=CAMNT_0014356983 /DNA_START=81 /DNA_END=388 /DNA_ORIENTATION=+